MLTRAQSTSTRSNSMASASAWFILPRTINADVHDDDLFGVPDTLGPHPRRRPEQSVHDGVLARLEPHHRSVSRDDPGGAERNRMRTRRDRVQPGPFLCKRLHRRPPGGAMRCSRVLTLAQDPSQAASSSANELYLASRWVSVETRSGLLVFTDGSVPPLEAGSSQERR